MNNLTDNHRSSTAISTQRILILDDEMEICQTMNEYFVSYNYGVRFCSEIHIFLTLVETYKPHVIIMDKYIQSEDTVYLIAQIRGNPATKDIPIILISGCSDFEEKIRALDLGADDVLIKPFRLEEMRAKVAALRRRAAVYSNLAPLLPYKHFTIDANRSEVFVADTNTKIDLTDTEFKIFYLLAISKGNLVVREKIVSKALTARNHSVRTIDVHINSLRAKLGQYGYYIKTMRGRGYMLID